MIVLDKLFKPLAYLEIRHKEKTWFDWIIPLLLSILLALIVTSLPKSVIILGKDGLISLVNGILQILSGFYIASMAAVATFQRDGMDKVMDGKAPTLKGIKLSRRQFLTYLFGYLAFMSIAVYFFGGFVQLAQNSISLYTSVMHAHVKAILLAMYFFVVFNILCTTVLGMHFMIDKIHRQKSELIDNKKQNKK